MSTITINGKYIAIAHGLFAYSAFLSALVIGCYLHYHKIVKNSSFGYPDEWFPSVSAAIGDRYPERSIFQILIAVTSGPRFLLLLLNFLKCYNPQKSNKLCYFTIISGVIRTFTCGGWVYITSTDDHDWHDIFMISYIVLTIPWTIGISKLSSGRAKTGRILTGSSFFLTLIPLVYWFIQHKVHVRPGAYSIYAYFEWALILLDVGFDCWSILDFQDLEISIGGSGLNVTKKVTKSSNKSDKPQKLVVEDDFSLFEFVINVVNSFILWSILTSLFLCVWYFPLWHMGISGYEASIVVLFLAPLFILVPFLHKGMAKFPFITRTLSVISGIGAYKVHEPEYKLLAVSIGSFFSILSFTNELSALVKNNDHKRLYSYSVAFMTGLLLSSIIKFGYYSNNPIWAVMHKPNGGHNEIGIFIGLVSSFLTPATTFKPKNQNQLQGGSMVLSILGFGGIFFCLFAYLTDSSILIFWNWSGFPVTGPTPITGALPHFASIAFGILFSISNKRWIISTIGFQIVGLLAAVSLVLFEDWNGFIGSCVWSFYLSSIFPLVVFTTVPFHSVIFSLSFFVCIILCLASVWIVAYAFVPGGFLLRERTDIMVGLSYLFSVLGVWNYKLILKKSKVVKFDIGKIWSKTLIVLTILLSLSTAFLFSRHFENREIKPFEHHKRSKSFNAGIWCVHFGIDNDMWSSHDRMRDLINDAELDIIGLLETDTERLIGGNRDFTQKIAEDLKMYVDYGPGPNKHTWGAALLSKFPIIKSQHFLLPSPVGELAPAILATLDIYGEFVDVVVFHSGQEEDVEDRRLQSLALQDIMGSSSRPMVLLSYLVTKPLEGNYFTYSSEKSRMHDIDSTDWDRWCEYIMFRDLKKVAYARISRSTITDTELQVGKFKLLDGNYEDDFLYDNNFIDEKDVPEDLRMPGKFKGRGIRGHKYHVFKKPRYFQLSP
ncbi:protein Cwh43p [[Candida] jaroonii]|uniref:Protein Cwh43p n=1 Tax=[Candida] jaroonii TaxID=467808 RepID=A0ACA9Y8V4_9ASCO|nr:protein Cwh43p [[Candida] jaroonii]